MDGYELLANSYQHVIDTREMSTEERDGMQLTVEALRCLVGKNEQFVAEMFNTGAFNDICKGYFKMSLKNCKLPQKTIDAVMDEFKWLLETKPAIEVTGH